MMNESLQGYVESVIRAYADKYDLRWRWHRLRADLPPTVGAALPQGLVLPIPTEHPFLLVAVAFASTREDDRRIVSTTIGTAQVKFVSQPTRLGIFGWPQLGTPPTFLPPSELGSSDQLEVTLTRDFPIDPAETYPGQQADSAIDIVFIGADLLRKGSQIDRQA